MTIKIALKTAISELLWADHYTINEKAVKGQQLDFLKARLLERGFRGLGNSNKFWDICEKLGFKVLEAKNARNQKARIVTL